MNDCGFEWEWFELLIFGLHVDEPWSWGLLYELILTLVFEDKLELIGELLMGFIFVLLKVRLLYFKGRITLTFLSVIS